MNASIMQIPRPLVEAIQRLDDQAQLLNPQAKPLDQPQIRRALGRHSPLCRSMIYTLLFRHIARGRMFHARQLLQYGIGYANNVEATGTGLRVNGHVVSLNPPGCDCDVWCDHYIDEVYGQIPGWETCAHLDAVRIWRLGH